MATKKITKKMIEHYLNLPWTYTIKQEIDGDNRYYIIRVNELPGVCTDAETIEEGMKLIKEAIEGAVALYLKNGEPVPIPISKNQCKGNISYRTTQERHYFLMETAQQKNISMNKMLDMVVDDAIQHAHFFKNDEASRTRF